MIYELLLVPSGGLGFVAIQDLFFLFPAARHTMSYTPPPFAKAGKRLYNVFQLLRGSTA